MYVKEAAQNWNISTRQVSSLCKDNKIPGAYKDGHTWIIPDDAKRPNDKRVKTGSYAKEKKMQLYIPLGVSDYAEITKDYYYVDKTLLIKTFLDSRAKVTLFTRPRRFGKTLNMSMLKYYFESSERDNSILFRDKAIWKAGKEYRAFQGRYPVIFLTFKDVKKNTWEETFDALYDLIRSEYLRHSDLKDSEKVKDRSQYEKIINKSATRNDVEISLKRLSQMLKEHFDISPIIIIDEYDTPIQQGYINGFYDDVVLFMRNLFSGAFKDNESLSFGFLTGILRVTKESLFSGLNNLDVQSILDNRYSSYFGFTLEEVEVMAKYFKREEKIDEIKDWYDGYQFGLSQIFNPWSVLSYFSKDAVAMPYWAHTGSNEIIEEILKEATDDTINNLTSLLNGESIKAYIDTNIVYPEIKDVPSRLYSFLLMTGYLKANKTSVSERGDYICNVSIPNKEILYTFNKEVLSKLNHIVSDHSSLAIEDALRTGDAERLGKEIEKLLSSASYYDTANESFYHGFTLALCALSSRYYTTSNRESGSGRYDIMLYPKTNSLPGIIIELKTEKKATKDKLNALAEDALKQIQTLDYFEVLRKSKISKVLIYGVAFSSKQVSVVARTM